LPGTSAQTHRLIEDDTPILPELVAESVVDEATRLAPDHADKLLSRRAELAAALTARANAVYEADHDSAWSKSIRGGGNRGRDTLYAFMRHWLAGDLKRNSPEVLAALPSGYGT
jgi:hypothetical protein